MNPSQDSSRRLGRGLVHNSGFPQIRQKFHLEETLFRLASRCDVTIENCPFGNDVISFMTSLLNRKISIFSTVHFLRFRAVAWVMDQPPRTSSSWVILNPSGVLYTFQHFKFFRNVSLIPPTLSVDIFACTSPYVMKL